MLKLKIKLFRDSLVLPFVKMHGLGNDFVIVEKKDLPANLDVSKLAINISRPHTGIGADQFIIYEAKGSNVDMFIYNQDGSAAKTCGNASRCLTSLLSKKLGLTEITLKVQDRLIPCEANDNIVSVNMGKVSFDAPWMLTEEKRWQVALRYSLEFKEIICVDIGNPHLIIFSPLSHQDMQIIGEQHQHAEFFKEGVNVNFVNIKDDKIHLSVWERGTGLTLACGSGACASFAASRKLGFVGDKAVVVFKLGELTIEQVAGDSIMTGPTSFIAEGVFYHDA